MLTSGFTLALPHRNLPAIFQRGWDGHNISHICWKNLRVIRLQPDDA
jgi:hypothetical protein